MSRLVFFYPSILNTVRPVLLVVLGRCTLVLNGYPVLCYQKACVLYYSICTGVQHKEPALSPPSHRPLTAVPRGP